MKKKVALAFVGLLLIMITSFAPITTATWHGLPDVQNDTYIIMCGQSVSYAQLKIVPLALPVSKGPYASRANWTTPGVQWQDINFSAPLDPDGAGPLPACIVFLTVPWQSIQSLSHVSFSDTLGYMRVRLLPVPGSDGMGWLYTVPGIADVDIHVNDTFMMNPLYNGSLPGPPTNPANVETIPIAFWTSPSPTPGAPAAVPGQTFYPFPDPGADTLPGFCPAGPGTQDDGFGDGVPDPAGSSVLFVPSQLSVESWNGTAWIFKFGGPFVLPLTTATCSDTVNTGDGRDLDGSSVSAVGAPWEDVATTGMWGANENKKFVTYAYAWSFIEYHLAGSQAYAPMYKLDLLYAGWETKVKEEHVIMDINCDGIVDIQDIVIAALTFGSADEGAPAPSDYDPTGQGSWPGPYPPYMPAPWFVVAQPNIAGRNFDARADVNADGFIDICDLVKIALDYGEILDP